MVAHLLRLKITLLRNSLRRSPWQLVGLIVGGLYALGLVGVLVVALLLLRQEANDVAHTVVVLGGAAAVLGWGIIPVAVSAADMTLDPARFTTFAVPMRQLLTGLALGGLIGIPGVATALVALATVGTWSRGVIPALAALLGAVLGVFTCIVLSKVATTATASLAASRRFKDVSGVVFMVPLILLGPLVAGVSQGISASAGFLPDFARTMAWTPLGAAWSLGGDIDAGYPGTAAAKLLIAVATVAALAWCWKILLERALVNPPYAGSGSRKGGKMGLFSILPATPTGAVTARALTYWLRDPRYGGSLIVIPLLALVMFFQASQGDDFGILLVLGPLTAFLMAWSISADVSYDNTAFALHLATGVRGVADRLGRALACLLLSVPVVLAFTFVPFAFTGSWEWLPGMLGLSVGILLTGLGLSSVVSARYNVAVPLPGDSPFKKPPGNVGQTMLVQFGGMGVLFLLVLPEAALIVAQSVTGNALFGWLNLALGTILGVVLFVLGVRLGGKWLDARGPELLAQLAVNR
ncbi:transporter [Arthrobacter oryzae]|jgi:ABC-2 type transport system permease protein|uniref:transporter n=1 Tax=Arthrobacter oryzae TaxID=409290 RepID=UPI002784AE3D|nr:transporter [Arthrobacter oryzae]MDQ0075368.1 ABC-2 type transport system permease protein [Arthrobacter oryzae]